MAFEDERELIDACKRGDSSAFNQIYEIYKDKVHSLGYYMTGEKEAAKDVTQQVFLKVFTSIITFQYKASFSSWLYRLSMNVCRDYQRSTRRMKLLSNGMRSAMRIYDSSSSLEGSFSKEGLSQAVQKCTYENESKTQNCSHFEIHRRSIVFTDCRTFGMLSRNGQFPIES